MFTAQDLSGFCGTEQYFHMRPLYSSNYTEGVQFIGSNGATWMLTDILSQLEYNPLLKKEEFVCITFQKNQDCMATITYDDGNGNVLETQEYDYTDCGVSEIKFFWTNGVLMLASEY